MSSSKSQLTRKQEVLAPLRRGNQPCYELSEFEGGSSQQKRVRCQENSARLGRTSSGRCFTRRDAADGSDESSTNEKTKYSFEKFASLIGPRHGYGCPHHWYVSKACKT